MQRARAALAGAVLAGPLLACAAPGDGAPPTQRVRDAAGMLESGDRAVLERELALLGRETGVDLFVTLATLDLDADLARRAAIQLDRLPAVGPPTHAAHLLHDARASATRLEIGYGLAPVVSDARAGAWLDEHVEPLVRSGRTYEALFLTTRMLQDDLRREALGGAFDPNPPGRLASLRHRSGGGGATSRELELPQRAGRVPARSQAPVTVDDAYAAYLAWLERADPHSLPPLFTEETRGYLTGWPLTPGYLEFVASREAGRAYEVLERGDRALLFFVDDPFVAPHFFRETDAGWKLDLLSEIREVVNLSGDAWSWSFRERPGAALAPFEAELIDVGGVRRLARGDNRPAVTFRDRP